MKDQYTDKIFKKMNALGFLKITLPLETNLFDELINSSNFESVAKGRVGNHLVKVEENGIPIVRTTTQYNIPPQKFSNVHHFIVEKINNILENIGLNSLSPLNFNNALIEVYDNTYSKMGYHSDQSLDLDSNSYIGLFSCYKNPEPLVEHQLRRLIVKEKDGTEEFEITLTHNSVVLFSVETNSKSLHKITLNSAHNQKLTQLDNQWLGITFRKSKTYIKIKDNKPYLSSGQRLNLANEEQKAEFFKLRGQENRLSDFIYPELSYTISVADILMPTNK